MSRGFDGGFQSLLRTVQDMIKDSLDERLRGIVAGGKVQASAIPPAALAHAMQSQAHTDVEHATLPNNGDVLVWDASRAVWTPSAVAAAAAGSPETLVIPGDPPDPVVADGDFIYVAYS